MNEASSSILAGDYEWAYHSDGRTMKFHKDGTGELICRCNFNIWIAAIFDWRILNSNTINKTERTGSSPRQDKNDSHDDGDAESSSPSSSSSSSPPSPDPQQQPPLLPSPPLGELLSHFHLEITLRKEIPAALKQRVPQIIGVVNEGALFDKAFDNPQTYLVTLEKGNYIEPAYVGYTSSTDKTLSRYGLRMVFAAGTSPYPRKEMWRDHQSVNDDCPFWGHGEFVARRLVPENDEDGERMAGRRALNDISSSSSDGWLGGVVKGCVVS